MSDGKVHATALTNAALSQLHLPAVPLGLVEGVPGLRPAALAKLRQQQETALEELEACLARLQEAVGALAAAVGTLQQLLEAEAAAPLMGEGAVFATLPLRLLGGMLGEVHSMHSAELAVKAGVVQGMRQVVGERCTQVSRAGWAWHGSACCLAASLPLLLSPPLLLTPYTLPSRQATCERPTSPAAAAAAALQLAKARGVRRLSARRPCAKRCRCT